MSMEVMMLGLLIASTLTGLTTEAIKKLLDEYNKTYHSNMLAGCVALIVSAAIGIGYITLTRNEWSGQAVVCVVVLVFLSWLCAMVGYDKVVQTISQIRKEN